MRELGEGVRERHIREDRLSHPLGLGRCSLSETVLAPVYPQVSTNNTRSFNSGQAFQVS